MEPGEKSAELSSFLEEVFGRTTAIENKMCVSCNGDIRDFRDELSRREYAISGLCQQCQDEVFGAGS